MLRQGLCAAFLSGATSSNLAPFGVESPPRAPRLRLRNAIVWAPVCGSSSSGVPSEAPTPVTPAAHAPGVLASWGGDGGGDGAGAASSLAGATAARREVTGLCRSTPTALGSIAKAARVSSCNVVNSQSKQP